MKTHSIVLEDTDLMPQKTAKKNTVKKQTKLKTNGKGPLSLEIAAEFRTPAAAGSGSRETPQPNPII